MSSTVSQFGVGRAGTKPTISAKRRGISQSRLCELSSTRVDEWECRHATSKPCCTSHTRFHQIRANDKIEFLVQVHGVDIALDEFELGISLLARPTMPGEKSMPTPRDGCNAAKRSPRPQPNSRMRMPGGTTKRKISASRFW